MSFYWYTFHLDYPACVVRELACCLDRAFYQAHRNPYVLGYGRNLRFIRRDGPFWTEK